MKARRSYLPNAGDNDAPAGGPVRCRLFRMPNMDIYECEAEYRLFLDVSGVGEEDVAVTLEGRIIRIEARAALSLASECHPLQVEFVVADYLREITVGRGVDAEKIRARLNDGVLELLLPKSKAATAKKIVVEAMARQAP